MRCPAGPGGRVPLPLRTQELGGQFDRLGVVAGAAYVAPDGADSPVTLPRPGRAGGRGGHQGGRRVGAICYDRALIGDPCDRPRGGP
jgi:hypothetical protein